MDPDQAVPCLCCDCRKLPHRFLIRGGPKLPGPGLATLEADEAVLPLRATCQELRQALTSDLPSPQTEVGQFLSAQIVPWTP